MRGKPLRAAAATMRGRTTRRRAAKLLLAACSLNAPMQDAAAAERDDVQRLTTCSA